MMESLLGGEWSNKRGAFASKGMCLISLNESCPHTIFCSCGLVFFVMEMFR